MTAKEALNKLNNVKLTCSIKQSSLSKFYLFTNNVVDVCINTLHKLIYLEIKE